jgi:hypothetical protein
MKYLLLMLTVLSGVACQETDKKVVYRGVNATNVTPTEYARVTQDFGALKVREGEFTGTTKIVPWSSWWFPTKDNFLFQSENSNELAPLQKYDLYVEKTSGENPSSALFEQMEIYDPSEVNWAGLCHAWAVASVLHMEPRFNVIRKDINLSVGDQKALILKSYENVGDLKIYGSRYNGAYNDDFDDVYPDQFHRFAQVHLFEKKLPFLMDYDPSFPVWTVPVYNIKFKIEKINETTASVKAWVTIASPFVDSPNFVGLKKSTKAYEYNLSGKWNGEELSVTSSEWLNESKFDHPDFLIAYPTGVKRASLNKKLDNKKIDEMVGLKFVDGSQP